MTYNECLSASDVSLKILQTGHSLFSSHEIKSFPITEREYGGQEIARGPNIIV